MIRRAAVQLALPPKTGPQPRAGAQFLRRQVMARANKERLAVLLAEIQRKEGGDERYKASLE